MSEGRTLDLAPLDRCTSAPPDESVLRGNLEALRKHQPALASALLKSSVGQSIRLVRRIDGTLDAEIPYCTEPDTPAAAPQARARGLYGSYRSSPHTFFLANCVSGFELRYLLDHCAESVHGYVRFASLVALQRILMPTSLVEELSAGRLLFVSAENLESELRELRKADASRPLPQTIIRPPEVPDEDVHRIQSIMARCFAAQPPR